MLTFFSFANHTFKISTLHPRFDKFAADYVIEPVDNPDAEIVISQKDIDEERELTRKSRQTDGLEPFEFSDDYLEITAVHRLVADWFASHNVLLMHGSVVAVDGLAYMFTAKSGTGKSTHSSLWRKVFADRAVMVNDDKPFISFDDDGNAFAWGSPWCGKHRLGQNMKCKLAAICWLERDTDNHIQQISSKEMLNTLLKQTYRPLDNTEIFLKVLALMDRLCHSVSFYRLGCNMDPQAALVAYNAMNPLQS